MTRNDPWWGMGKLARFLGASLSTATRLVRSGEIEGHRIGSRYKVRRSAAQAYIDRRRVSPSRPVQARTSNTRAHQQAMDDLGRLGIG